MRSTLRAPLTLLAALRLIHLPARAATRTEELHLSLAPGPLRLALRTVPKPVLDFRFGPVDRAILDRRD